jgi:hypothetical protein
VPARGDVNARGGYVSKVDRWIGGGGGGREADGTRTMCSAREEEEHGRGRYARSAL